MNAKGRKKNEKRKQNPPKLINEPITPAETVMRCYVVQCCCVMCTLCHIFNYMFKTQHSRVKIFSTNLLTMMKVIHSILLLSFFYVFPSGHCQSADFFFWVLPTQTRTNQHSQSNLVNQSHK